MNNTEQEPTPPTYCAISHLVFEDRGIDFMSALAAVMSSERYAELTEKERAAALAWFKSKYLA